MVSKLKELQEHNIPCMTLEKLVSIDEYSYLSNKIATASKEEIDDCNSYFSKFCAYGYNDGKDIFSDEACVFSWGLRHVELVTDDNGMTRRYYHYITLNGAKIRVGLGLQWHPSGYDVEED